MKKRVVPVGPKISRIEIGSVPAKGAASSTKRKNALKKSRDLHGRRLSLTALPPSLGAR